MLTPPRALHSNAQGRNWEVATEDPFLGGRIGEAYAKGFQTAAADPHHLLGIITLKHWAGYSVEKNRGGCVHVSVHTLLHSARAGMVPWRLIIVSYFCLFLL